MFLLLSGAKGTKLKQEIKPAFTNEFSFNDKNIKKNIYKKNIKKKKLRYLMLTTKLHVWLYVLQIKNKIGKL